MSDYSMINDFDQFQVERMPADKTDEKFMRIIKLVVGVLCSLLFLEVMLYKVIIPSLKSPHIVFSGQKNYTNDELMAAISPVYHGNWYSFDTDTILSRINEMSGIESVVIEKHFPDRISISVKERESVAMTFVSEQEKSTAVQIDKNGVLFSFGNNKSIEDNSIPIISGLPIEYLSGGMRIPGKYRVLIDQISKIRSLHQAYFSAISEIIVIPREFGNYELVIIPVNSRARVLTDRSLNEDALQYMMVVLEVVNKIEPDAKEIDLRYGSVSYRTSIQGGGTLE